VTILRKWDSSNDDSLLKGVQAKGVLVLHHIECLRETEEDREKMGV